MNEASRNGTINLHTEYQEQFQFRHLPRELSPPPRNPYTMTPTKQYYTKAAKDAYKPVDPSAYKRERPLEEEEEVGPRHVDPDHFRSTTQDAYKPVDPSAYRRERPQEEEEEVGPRHVDPDHFRSTTQ
ncbi:microtubule-associated protein, partial [Trypanosoma conorhini]